MKLIQFYQPGKGPRVGVVRTDQVADLTHAEEGIRSTLDLLVQGKTVAENFDVFAKVGKDHAYDVSVPDVRVTGGAVDIAFAPRVEFPFLSAVEIVGTAEDIDDSGALLVRGPSGLERVAAGDVKHLRPRG